MTMKTRSASLCAFCAVFGFAFSAMAAETYVWTADGTSVNSDSYVKIFDDVGPFNGRLRLVGFSTAEGDYIVTSNRVHELASASSAIGALPAGSYVHQMSVGARFDGTTTKSLRVQLAQPANSYALYARITAVATADGDHTDEPDLRVAIKDDKTVEGEISTAAADLLANAVTKIVVGVANVTLTWDASATPATLGDAETGLLEFTYVDGKVKTLTAAPVDGGTIVLTGDTISFAASATNTMAAAGELVFSNAVAGAGGIACTRVRDADDYTLSYSGDNLDTEYTVLFPNCRLEAWMPWSAGNKGGKGWWQVDDCKVYNIRHETDGSITAQRQGWIDLGGGVSGIAVTKFQLKQIGNDIAGRVLYGGYWYAAKAPVRTDSDAVIANPETYGKFVNQGVSTPSDGNGYGMNKVTLYRVGGLPTIRFAGGLTMEGRLIAMGFTHVILERAKTGNVKGCYSPFTNGMITFRDPKYNFDPSSNAAGTGALADGLTGSGTVVIEATDTLFGDESWETEPMYVPWIPKDEWVTIAENRQLSNMTNVTAYFDGGGMNGAYKNKLEHIYALKSKGDGTYSGQFQHKSGWLAAPNQTQCVMVEFRQNGADVQMRGTGVGMVGNTTSYRTTELTVRTDISYTTSSSVSHYGIHGVRPYFTTTKPAKMMSMGRYPGIRNMAGSSDGPGGVATLVVKGTDNTIMRYAPATGNGHVLPLNNGLLRVQRGGEVIQQMSGRTSTSVMWANDQAQIYIEQGGVYSQQSNWGVGITQRVDIAGGEYRVRDIGAVTSGQCILNLLTLSGGVRLHSLDSADFICAGSTNGAVNAVWTVRGTSSSSCDIPLRLWSASSGGTMTFAVNDVASGSDFIMNGAVDVNPQFSNVTVYKTGPGTMELNASYNVGTTPTLLKGGTWLFNASSLAASTSPYTIDGGTLAVAGGTSNSLGVLTVGENGGGIALGEGATLAFADSSAAEWAAGGNVVITGFVEKAIRFGTDGSALTAAQQRRFRTSEGRHLILDTAGNLVYPGLVIFIR